MKHNGIFIANVDHIISITVIGERPCSYWGYHPEYTYIERQGFWRKKVNVVIPEHYNGMYTMYVGMNQLEEDIKLHSGGNAECYIIKEPEGKNKFKTVIFRPKVDLVLSGGKYTGKHTLYFTTYKEARNFVMALDDKHKDKFLIIEEE
jgi:hypothetical protein